MTDEKCPRCKVGFIQRTALTPPDKGEAIGCTRCTYPVGEPGFSSDLSYDPLEVDEGWEPPYRPVLTDKEMGDKVRQAVAPMWHNIVALQKELEVAQSLHKVAVRERDYERTLCDNYKKDYYDLRSLYEGVLSRINKLEDDTRAAIEFADLAEDDKGTEMILEFCEDITKLVGE